MQVVTDIKRSVDRNIDKKMFFTGLAVTFAAGGILYALNRSNVKLLKGVATVAKGGK